MTASRLHRIEIRNFKAFREFSLNLEGRHLLVHGLNGSGKSSLYWALYTFLQSAGKSTPDVVKYFDPSHDHNLLNIHEDASAVPGEIALTVRDTATNTDTTHRISQTKHETRQQPGILKADLASDFITYRFFFGFSHFRNSQTFDLWPLFEKEILPFCVSTSGQKPLQSWNTIKSGNPNPWCHRGPAGTNAYDDFRARVNAFAGLLPGIVDSISRRAQTFYDDSFAENDPVKVTLKLGVTRKPSFTGHNQANCRFLPPQIGFGIKIGSTVVERPQVFLNEAKLTQLALSVRLAASLVNLHESDLKLLVIDDLLVSLDMSNRMKVVDILLSDTFANYQKLILTHDLGFFREFRRRIGSAHPDWSFLDLEGAANTRITTKTVKTDVQKAEDYLHGHDLEEAALCLRKACEDTAKRFTGRSEVVPTKEFIGLAAVLREARSKVLSGFPTELYQKVLKNTPEAHRDLLVALDDTDIDSNPDLDAPTKGKLKSQRKRLRTLLSAEHVERLRQVQLIDGILACTERVLNPAAHSGDPPLYEREVQDAMDLIKQLESALP